MTDLAGLLERVERATGPDRELDRDIHLALGLPVEGIELARTMVADGQGDDYLPADGSRRLLAKFVASSWVYPDITASIDAALALVERKLPGWTYNVGQNVWHGYFHTTLYFKKPTGSASAVELISEDGSHPTSAPLSIISCLLRALIAGAGDE